MPCEADIWEDCLSEWPPDLLNALLKDHTTSKEGRPRNIFWATTDYESLGKGYEYGSPILPELLTGENGRIVMPRVLKARDTQRDRSRDMAEVFTPSWICNAQNNLIDEAWFGRKDAFNHENEDHTWSPNPDKIAFPKGRTWRDYVREVRLEITCGEAPYLVSRYDAATGRPIALNERIGLLDRKLRVVSENTETPVEWTAWAQAAFQSAYAYEWQGDSLLIARENLLAAFTDAYRAKFGSEPQPALLLPVAHVVSWNVWQMDGLKGVVPGSCGVKPSAELSLFGEEQMEPCQGCRTGNVRQHNGTYCIVRDWEAKPPKDKIRFVDFIQS